MTFTIRVIDPRTGTSQYHSTATLEAAFFLISGIHDKHITIHNDVGELLSEIFPIPDEPSDIIERQLAALGIK